MNDDRTNTPTADGARMKAMSRAWSDFSRKLNDIKGRITKLKTNQDNKERDAKLKSIQQAIDEHR